MLLHNKEQSRDVVKIKGHDSKIEISSIHFYIYTISER